MPCSLTSGYALDCKDSAGGITEVYFIEKGNVSSIAANASGVVTGITKASGKRFWKYELPKETGNFTHNLPPPPPTVHPSSTVCPYRLGFNAVIEATLSLPPNELFNLKSICAMFDALAAVLL